MHLPLWKNEEKTPTCWSVFWSTRLVVVIEAAQVYETAQVQLIRNLESQWKDFQYQVVQNGKLMYLMVFNFML